MPDKSCNLCVFIRLPRSCYTGFTVLLSWYPILMSSYCNSFEVRVPINTLRPRQNGRHFPDDTFKRIFLNDNVRISIKISLKFVPKGPIINIPALVQIMAWCRPGDKPLSEPMMVSLLTHICVTRPQWVNEICGYPVFKGAAVTWQVWEGTRIVAPAMAPLVTWHCSLPI